eukprot:UC1_evm1s1845
MQPHLKSRFAECHDVVRDRTNCWDLNSFIIKPVQRILKYPLLLNELIAATESEHPDHTFLMRAASKMGDVAAAINEGKRRRELVNKYTRNKDTGLGARLAKVNMHTLGKKTQRLRQKVFFSKKDDAEFAIQVKKLNALDGVLKKLIKRGHEHSQVVREVYESQADHANKLKYIYEENPYDLPAATSARLTAWARLGELAALYQDDVQRRVLKPLESFQGLFADPLLLIEKRADKKLDYDSFARQYAAATDPDRKRLLKKDLDLAQSNFEAMNDQLMEELPRFWSMGKQFVARCLTALLLLENRLAKDGLGTLEPVRNRDISAPQVVEECERRHKLVIMDLLTLQSVPVSLAKIWGVAAPSRVGKRGVSQVSSDPYTAGASRSPVSSSSRASSRRTITNGSASMSRRSGGSTSAVRRKPQPVVEEEEEEEEEEGEEIEFIGYAQALFAYDADAASELTVAAGEVVGIIGMADSNGNAEWWHVSANGDQGFVPANYLQEVELEIPEDQVEEEEDEQVQPEPEAGEEDLEPIGTAKVLFDFEASSETELSVQAEEIVIVLEQVDASGTSDWWLVENHAGARGYVPSNYMEEQ